MSAINSLVEDYKWISFIRYGYSDFENIEIFPNKEDNTLYVMIEPSDSFDLSYFSEVFWYNKPDNIEYFISE